jgi:hypothetical protein
MQKDALNPTSLGKSLQELADLGSPVDLSVAFTEVARAKVMVEQVDFVGCSTVFELEDGRAGLIADIAVTNRTTRPFQVLAIDLRTPWDNAPFEWLTAQHFGGQSRKTENCGYELYQFPGQKAPPKFEYDCVINHFLREGMNLPGQCRREGFLLGIADTFVRADLHHGQTLDLDLEISGIDKSYVASIQVWIDRLESQSGSKVLEETFRRDKPHGACSATGRSGSTRWSSSFLGKGPLASRPEGSGSSDR